MSEKTKHISELSEDERKEFDECGCEEGYRWYLKHQRSSVLQSQSDDEFYSLIDEYHGWMAD